MSVKRLFLFCLLILLFSSVTELFPQQDVILRKLSGDADVILTGKVIKQESAWNENKTRIITHTTIKSDEYLKGNVTAGSVVVTHPGGEVDGVGEIYSHMPAFRNDEEVLVFLKKNKTGSDYNIVGGEEGKIVIMNSASGEKITASNVPVNMLKAQIQKFTNQ